MTSVCDKIEMGYLKLFTCSDVGEYTQVRTPYLYPDGDFIDVYIQSRGDRSVVSDLGETMRWLGSQSLSTKKSHKQLALIHDICSNHEVLFYRGMIMAKKDRAEELSDIVTRVAQASMRVSDIYFMLRGRSVIQSINDDIEDFFQEKHLIYTRSEKLPGRSGHFWTVDFHTCLPQKTALICTLSTGNRAAAKRMAEHVIATWHDLSYLKVGREAQTFISLFDDTIDVWSNEDFNLLELLSEIAYWSRPDEFAERLLAA